MKERPSSKSLATLAGATGLAVVGGVLAVDGLGEDARTSGLSYTARTAEEVGVGQFARLDRIAESGGQRVLADDVGKTSSDGICAQKLYIRSLAELGFGLMSATQDGQPPSPPQPSAPRRPAGFITLQR